MRPTVPRLEAEPQSRVSSGGFRLGHRTCLDGLRGIAVLSVLVAHANLVGGCLGSMGVDIFFALSGFLITCLLLEEWDELHAVSLKAFYMRRVLRLLPALSVMLVVFVAFHWCFSPRVAARQSAVHALIALFYSSNWAFALGFRQPVHSFAHTWTLSIEEQFYLTWPAILLLLLRRTGSRASMLTWVVFGLFIIVLEKVMILVATANGGVLWLNFATEARADALLSGCAAAIALSSGLLPSSPWPKLGLKSVAWGVALPGLVLLNVCDVPAEFYRLGLDLAFAVLAVVIILHILIEPTGVLHRFLGLRWLGYFGKISYGLYLWHYPVFLQVQTQHWPQVKELTIELALTGVATLASFYLLERPILQFKRRFAYSRAGHGRSG